MDSAIVESLEHHVQRAEAMLTAAGRVSLKEPFVCPPDESQNDEEWIGMSVHVSEQKILSIKIRLRISDFNTMWTESRGQWLRKKCVSLIYLQLKHYIGGIELIK